MVREAVNEPLVLRFTNMARFTAGRYEIERGPGERWAFTAYPPAEEVKTLEDLKALAVVAHAAVQWTEPTTQHQGGELKSERG